MVALLLAAMLQIPAQHQAKVAWVPNPRRADGTWVSDASHHLTAATLTALNAAISALEAETGAEIAVVVVDSLSGLTPQEFALAIHRGWGVGKRDRDNGVVFLWDPVDRQVFLSIGYGLEGAIPDRRAGRIRDQEIFRAFHSNHFDEGVLAGVRALAAAAREERDPAIRAARGRTGPSGLEIVTGILGLGVAGVGGVFGVRRWKRRRPRNCTQGHPMRLLDDREEIGRLDKGARLEQRLGSVDWDVWACDTCGETMRLPYPHGRWGECPTCQRRTVKSVRTVVTSPTTVSAGLARITKTCQNCGWKTTRDEVIPVVVPSSSDASSGGGSSGSSFGGGSAGGGGAGGSY